jgi:hypothetical protein
MHIFFALPFAHTTSDNLRRPSSFNCGLFDRIGDALTDKGYSVFSKHRQEDSCLSIQDYTVIEFLQMQLADCVIAFPEESPTVHLELGWAIALGKPIVFILDESKGVSEFLDGLLHIKPSWAAKVSPSSTHLEQERFCTEMLDLVEIALQSTHPLKQESVVFLSTSFGFGPVSKASTIARELKTQAANLEIHYIGAGIDYDFAVKSETFDRVLRINTDDKDTLLRIVPLLCFYKFVFSVLNLEILPLWPSSHPPLYFVDSLAWMWSTLPEGVQNTKAYFIQNYLVPRDRIECWRKECPAVHSVAPIIRKVDQQPLPGHHLVVNFSGCANPFADSKLFEKYVDVLARAVLKNAVGFNRVIFCCNEHLRGHLGKLLADIELVVIDHFAHESFLKVLATASKLLTSPGITTTLEANSMNKPIRFLLPQNYSQALMSEQYRRILGEQSGMALSRFGPMFEIEPCLPEAEGVARVTHALDVILNTREDEINHMMLQLLTDQALRGTLELPIAPAGGEAGQQTIVTYALSVHTVAKTTGAMN